MHSFTNNFLGRCFYSYEYTTPWATLRQQRIWSCKTRFIDNTNYLEWHAKHQQYPLKQLSYLLRCPFSGRIACKIQYSGETYKKKLSKNRSLNFYQRASWKYWPTFLGYNKISSSRHEQLCLMRLRFERYLSHHRRSISRNGASLNILVHDVMNLLYYEHWTDKHKYLSWLRWQVFKI